MITLIVTITLVMFGLMVAGLIAQKALKPAPRKEVMNQFSDFSKLR